MNLQTNNFKNQIIRLLSQLDLNDHHQLKEMCNMLNEKYHISHVIHLSIHKDGKISILSTSNEICQILIGYFSQSTNKNIVIKMMQSSFIFLHELASINNSVSDLKSALSTFGINELVCQTSNYKDYSEVMIFLAKTEQNKLYLSYLKHRQEFLKFNILFYSKMKKVIDRQLGLLQNTSLSESLSEIIGINSNLENVNDKSVLNSEEAKIDRIYLGFINSDVYLTFRELECLYNLQKYKRRESVADAMKISKRTVDGYVKELRHKFNYRGKLYSSNFIKMHHQIIDIFKLFAFEL